MSVEFVPFFDRVLLRPIDDEAQTTPSGLVVPQMALGKRSFVYGEVIAVGPGRHDQQGNLIKCKVKVGDVCAMPRGAGTSIPWPDETGREVEVVVVREPDLLGKVTGLQRASSIVGLDGDLLKMVPQSNALPDSVDKNIDDHARAKHALKDAPPDVLQILEDYRDDPR